MFLGAGPSVADLYEKSIEASVSDSKELIKNYEKRCQDRGGTFFIFNLVY